MGIRKFFSFQQPVRFKGVQVLDLLRLASGKEAISSAGMPVFVWQDFAQIISTVDDASLSVVN